jgi:hypothetical protein
LHGAAHTTATLAALGHGSLAAGGMGMAGGAQLLGGIVLLPVATIAGFIAHAKANDLAQKAAEIEDANRANSKALVEITGQHSSFDHLESRVASATDSLEDVIEKIDRELFRFGVLSRLYRTLRQAITGQYYTAFERTQVNRLLDAIEDFLCAVGVGKSSRAQSAGSNTPAKGLLLR